MPWMTERLGHQVADPHPGVERGHRVLEHHLHVAADLGQRLGVELPSGDLDLAREGDEADEGLGDGGLAAAGFADQRERLAGADLETHALGGMDAVAHPLQQARAEIVGHGDVVQTGDRFPPCAGVGGRGAAAHAGHRVEKRAGVGVGRGGEECPGLVLFDLAAGLHDDDTVGHLGHHAHVVGDEHDGGAHLPLQRAQTGRAPRAAR